MEQLEPGSPEVARLRAQLQTLILVLPPPCLVTLMTWFRAIWAASLGEGPPR